MNEWKSGPAITHPWGFPNRTFLVFPIGGPWHVTHVDHGGEEEEDWGGIGGNNDSTSHAFRQRFLSLSWTIAVYAVSAQQEGEDDPTHGGLHGLATILTPRDYNLAEALVAAHCLARLTPPFRRSRPDFSRILVIRTYIACNSTRVILHSFRIDHGAFKARGPGLWR